MQAASGYNKTIVDGHQRDASGDADSSALRWVTVGNDSPVRRAASPVHVARRWDIDLTILWVDTGVHNLERRPRIGASKDLSYTNQSTLGGRSAGDTHQHNSTTARWNGYDLASRERTTDGGNRGLA